MVKKERKLISPYQCQVEHWHESKSLEQTIHTTTREFEEENSLKNRHTKQCALCASLHR